MPDLLELGQLGGIGVLLESPRLFRLAKMRRQLAGPDEEVEGGSEEAQAKRNEDEKSIGGFPVSLSEVRSIPPRRL